MLYNKYIRKFLAVVSLAAFALSNTPTKYLHELFANHTDFVCKTLTNSPSPQLNVAGIDCHCQSNVVIAPYTPGVETTIAPMVPVVTEFILSATHKNVFFPSITFGLRGPPSLA